MKRGLIVIGLSLFCSLIFTGCGSVITTSTAVPTSAAPAASTSSKPAITTTAATTAASSVATTAASTALTPQSGGTLNVFFRGSSINSIGYPATMSGLVDGQTASPCVEGLFRFDENANLIPLLATGWKGDATAKTITITLRKGVKFHDGSDFNAASCKWNLDTFRTGGRTDLAAVTSVDIVDDYSVRLNLSQYLNTVISYLAQDAGRMVSPTAIQANGKAWAEKNPVGTGAFQFVSYKLDVGISFKRFDGYWDGKPYLDNLNFLMYADKTVASLDFQAGKIDVYFPALANVKSLSASGQFNSVVSVDAGISALAGYATDVNSPFSNILVRKALAYAIDTKSVCDALGYGYYKVITQCATPGTWAYNPNIVGYPYDPQKARNLLAQAGYPNGLNTTLNFYNTDQSAVDAQTTYQSYLKAAGINATLNPMLRSAYVDAASLGKGWNGIIGQIINANVDPSIKYINMATGKEFTGMYLPQEFVDAYNQAITAVDANAKQQAVWNMAYIANDKYCMQTPIFASAAPVFKSKKLHDDLIGNIPDYYMSPKAWLSK